MPRQSYCNNAFTLTELLVVILIITLLAAIIFPVFGRVREKGHQTVCFSNLRQLGLAFAAYAQDYDDYFALGGDPADLNAEIWVGKPQEELAKTLGPLPVLLHPYTKNNDLWHCPSDSGFDFLPPEMTVPLPARPSSFGKYGNSYYYRTRLALDGLHFSTVRRTITDRNTHEKQEFGPAEIGYLYDGSGEWHGDRTYDFFNTLHADGHVRTITMAAYQKQWRMVLSD